MLRIMSRRILAPQTALARTSMLARHLSSSSATQRTDESLVQFESNLTSRTFILNRSNKMNALDHSMINTLKSKLLEWNSANLCEIIIGTGKGRAFCAGGDIAAIMNLSKTENTRSQAVAYFKDEFELNHLVANLSKPYVAIMDGITMGGGAGISIHAPFRVATEKTWFAMPETKIGYCPDVGSNYFLARLDGEVGTYLAMTGTIVQGRAVFELGLATHFIPSSRVQDLKDRLSSLPENLTVDQTYSQVNAAIEELYMERSADESPSVLTGEVRSALDAAFSGRTAEDIIASLTKYSKTEDQVGKWAKATLEELSLRSPTSLKVSLEAVRRGKRLSLPEILDMELGIAAAYINGASPDFITGVTAVLIEKIKGRPAWNPENLSGITDDHVKKTYFDPESPFLKGKGKLDFVVGSQPSRPDYGLPSEEEIGARVRGDHPDSGGTSLNVEELVQQCEFSRHGKYGVREKVLDVVQRRCKNIPETSSTEAHLEWIH